MPVPPPDAFAQRHLGPSEADVAAMLEVVGVDSLEALVGQTVPDHIREDAFPGLPAAVSEVEALAELRRIAGDNQILRSYIGMGYHGTVTPPVLLRNVLENPGWYTAYTPYQAEISQGRLEALLIFQSVVQELCGLDIANASLLDEATAAAEAMTLSWRQRRHEGTTYLVDERVHPQILGVLQTRAGPLGLQLAVGRVEDHDLDAVPVFGALVAYPCTDGSLVDLSGFVERAHAAGVLVTACTDLLALAVLRPPGAIGIDIAVGNAQRFGVPMGYGGPHAGFMATRGAFKRQLPGRLIGVSRDVHGDPALRMALQTREQHIRRQKATSNICTAQVLLAVVAGLYAVWHGPEGLIRIATRVHGLALALADGARRAGLQVGPDPFFDTVRIEAGARVEEILGRARGAGINLRELGGGGLSIALDETVDEADLADLLEVLGCDVPASVLIEAVDPAMPEGFARTTPFLQEEVFRAHRSETEMLRYLHRLQSRDVALDTSMIPLGSCTMKLNATTEMIPITWPGFNALHPFVPREQAQGYTTLFQQLEGWLAAITGFDAVSLQPNAGSQGEYTGLLVIRAWHRSRGEGQQRDVCLIPTSAHGTNPASAVMAGLRVVPVACDDQGNIDVDDLRNKADTHADALAALMVTYPSTHGVFEVDIEAICSIVHERGGQVYMDGANMNAMVGLCRPGSFGADVAHLNLHKTFCLAEGTPVSLGVGLQQPIETLSVGQEVKAWSEQEGGVQGARLDAAFRTGRRPCVTITFEDGRTLTCTEDHRVRTTDGWVEAGALTPDHRVIAGLEAPIDDGSCSDFSLQLGPLRLSMASPGERVQALAFFRLMGATLSSGSFSQERGGRCQIRLTPDTRQDARLMVADIERLTGEVPKISSCNEIFSVSLPAELVRALQAVPGIGTPGDRVASTASLPDVVSDEDTPIALRREFFGALFGGDGVSPELVLLRDAPDTLTEIQLVQHRLSERALARLMEDIQLGLARLGVDVLLSPPAPVHPPPVGSRAPRWRSVLTVRWGVAFSERIGFRYCQHKSARLTAATAWWRLKETIRDRRRSVAEAAITQEGASDRRPTGWRRWVREASEHLSQSSPIMSPYFVGFAGHRVLNRQHLLDTIEGRIGERSGVQGARRAHQHAVPAGVPTVTGFLERIGARGWFSDRTPQGELCKVTYATTSQDEIVEPTIELSVVGIRSAGEQTVYDLTVDELHNFLASGVVVHNCIPHGGGGPGMGPIGVAAHLTPFLPGHPVIEVGHGEAALGPVSAAPWGSPSILPISWAYIRMLGLQGLIRASELAILNANYIACRLQPHYNVLYRGDRGRVAHECILDLRPFKAVGVQVDDVAKRLMDFGFHAPTMSFPVAGTLMVEPTESEGRAEIDRFCDAMIAIREEIRAVERGEVSIEDSALRHAPHTAGDVTRDDWDRPYSRQTAAFPAPWTRRHKAWPAVGRIDNVYGDRHLICTCDAWPDA